MGTRTLEVPARSEVCASSAAPDPNSKSSLAERAHRGTLRWAGPLMVVVGRSVFMIAAQVVAVAVIWLRSHTWSWNSAAKWWTVYGTLVDVGCMAMMAVVHTQGRNPRQLIGRVRIRWGHDLWLGIGHVWRSLSLFPALG